MAILRNFQNHDIRSTYTLHMAAPTASETFRSMDELNKFYVLAKELKNLLNHARLNTEKRTQILSSGALYGGFDETRVSHISESERQAPAYAESLQALSIGKRVSEFLTKNFVIKITLMRLSLVVLVSLGPAYPPICTTLLVILWRSGCQGRHSDKWQWEANPIIHVFR